MKMHLIGRYEVQSEIGRGGMARVFLAIDPHFKREVAIKMLPDDYLHHPVLRKRFEREARAIATLEHPAIVPVYDYNEHEGQLYLVMRYMPGSSLSVRLRRGTFSLPDTAALIARLALALEAVHTKGIVHRDLKPANILFDAYNNAYLSDFGIVYLAEATSALTGNSMMGTPAYMSPEQVQGFSGEIDQCSDLYSLGIIVFEMLTGRQPFRASTPVATAMQHLNQPVPSALTYRAGLPAEIDDFLQKALAKDPSQRFQSAESLAAQLSALANGQTQPDKQAPPPANQSRSVQEDASTLITISDLSKSGQQPAVAKKDLSTRTKLADPPAAAGGARQPSVVPLPRSRTPSWAAPGWLWLAGSLLGLGALFFLVVVMIGARFLSPSATNPAAPLAQSAASELENSSLPDASEAAPTTAPQEPSHTDVEGWQVVLDDRFTIANSNWPSGEGLGGRYGYAQGAYFIDVNGSEELYWVTPDIEAGDVSLSVTTTTAQGGEQDYFGLLCRLQDANHYYYLVINPQGEYMIGKYQEGEFISLLENGWSRSEAIRPGQATNQLRADCIGDRLSLYTNGDLLAEARDADFPAGQFGLLAATAGDDKIYISFDNFSARVP